MIVINLFLGIFKKFSKTHYYYAASLHGRNQNTMKNSGENGFSCDEMEGKLRNVVKVLIERLPHLKTILDYNNATEESGSYGWIFGGFLRKIVEI